MGRREKESEGGSGPPPEDPPKTRKNRITAVGNDLYSADSRSFLNPFLRVPRCVRAFFHRTLDIPIHDSPPELPLGRPTLSATDPISPPQSSSLSLCSSSGAMFPMKLAYKFRACYTFPRNGNCSVSQIMPALFSRRESSAAFRALARFRASHVPRCPETSIPDTLT